MVQTDDLYMKQREEWLPRIRKTIRNIFVIARWLFRFVGLKRSNYEMNSKKTTISQDLRRVKLH